MAGLTIGQVARQAGLGVETVRFYERRGLIEEPPRRRSGYRAYPAEAVRRLRFIRRAKELGFSLAEVGELLSLRAASRAQCARVRTQVEAKMADIEERISDLARMQHALGELLELCRREPPTSECPILDLLEEGGIG